MFFKLFHYISGNNTAGENVLKFYRNHCVARALKNQASLIGILFSKKNLYMFQKSIFSVQNRYDKNQALKRAQQ